MYNRTFCSASNSGQALPEVNTEQPLTEMSGDQGADEFVFKDAGELLPTMTLDPKAPGEDLPFPIDDGAAD
ncbi:hypothetical protein [Deinococcus hohokamensis]|uniref:Uncharacterized protein n=1 Tax=Deinococcus hohokamensis TaxID=309883 RepID=A0ABV9IAU6_9DEIO